MKWASALSRYAQSLLIRRITRHVELRVGQLSGKRVNQDLGDYFRFADHPPIASYFAAQPLFRRRKTYQELATGWENRELEPQISDKVRNRFLSIFSDLILDSSVDRGMPNFAAALVGPNTRPRLAFKAS